jgi:hypothetical protein
MCCVIDFIFVLLREYQLKLLQKITVIWFESAVNIGIHQEKPKVYDESLDYQKNKFFMLKILEVNEGHCPWGKYEDWNPKLKVPEVGDCISKIWISLALNFIVR